MTDPHPYRDEKPTRAPRRRWVLPVSIAGGIAVAAVGAVIAALLLAPAPKPEAGASPKPSAPVSASPSASPKPAAKPSPRIRIDCESVLDRTIITAYLGAAPSATADRARYLEGVPWLQVGGLGCTWESGNRYLRVTALARDAFPGVDEVLRDWSTGVKGDIVVPPPADPAIECMPYCSAKAATDRVVIYVTDLDYDDEPDTVGFPDLARTAIAAVAAAPVVPAWVPPYPTTVRLPAECEDGVDPDGVMARALGIEPGGWTVPGGDGEDALVIRSIVDGPYLECASSSEEPVFSAAPGGRWAWDPVRAGSIADGAVPTQVAGAEEAVVVLGNAGSGTFTAQITVLAGDAILRFSSYADSEVEAQSRSARASEAWLAHYVD
ncbi:hypothetical protein GCM10027515_01150 [Schumannella luteola]|uniref:DUF3558 domain-containing protein n=1 Tax=Schumannella luteola TaxID=472059 RepID=A0A852YNF2_9MICO|nr:hypothetical protein [Schumannella luteola]NYG98745.1 hypothetical protein [Schumannella luteola]TPX04329.1 hypothetical protein FJ656_12775 [Schumannella luteola]